MRLGQEFTLPTRARSRPRQKTRSRSSAELLRELGLGGSAVGTGINTHPDYREKAIKNLARISGQKLVAVDDMRYAMQSNLAMAAVSSALRNLALEVIRISNDLRLLASGPNTGLAEINLPALQPGSSIMPGKINPVIPELAAMVAFQVVGNDVAVAMAVQAGQLELNVMMPTMAYSVLQSITILTNMLCQFTDKCVVGITANEQRCNFYARPSDGVASDRIESAHVDMRKLPRSRKKPWRAGDPSSRLPKAKRNCSSEKEINEILDPVRMTEPVRPLDAAKKREEIKGNK